MDNSYADHVLDASDVCRNCLRIVRVERIDPTRIGDDDDSSYERHRQHTIVDYGPADAIADERGTFCDRCGTESPHDRYWDPSDIDEDRFRELLRNLLATLNHKDVTVHDQQTAAGALQAFRDGADPDAALAAGVERGLAVAVASNRTSAETATA